MVRKNMERLIDWREYNSQFPLYLTGARGVGKTYLALEFAKEHYSVILYHNFETDPGMDEKIRGLYGEQLIQELFRYNQQSVKDTFLSLPFHDKSTLVECDETVLEEILSQQSTVLILDEISYSSCIEQILCSVIHSKYKIHIILINSRYDMPQVIQNKVVLVHQISCAPMDFEEFLQATGNEWYIGVINEHFDSNVPVPEIVHKELNDLYDIYIKVGGLPEAVDEYLSFSNLSNVAERHRLRMGSFLQDINCWENQGNALKMKQIVETIPNQLLKKNKKFQYTYIRKGVTRSMYEEAMEALQQTYYVIPSEKMMDDSQMKLYWFDTGFLSSIFRSNQCVYTQPDAVYAALLENSVAQAFHSKEYHLRYWESGSSAKLDFVIGKNNLLPIELYMDENTRSKSFSVFKLDHDFDYAVKLSAKNFRYHRGLKYVPYYAVTCL